MLGKKIRMQRVMDRNTKKIKQRKYPGPSKIPSCGGGPGFGYPQRGFALLEVH